MPAADPTPPRRRPALMILLLLLLAGMLICAPLLFPRWNLNKYFVALGLLLACAGISLLLQAMFDLLTRSRNQRPATTNKNPERPL